MKPRNHNYTICPSSSRESNATKETGKIGKELRVIEAESSKDSWTTDKDDFLPLPTALLKNPSRKATQQRRQTHHNPSKPPHKLSRILKRSICATFFLFLPISAAIIFNSDEEPGVRCFCDKQTCGGGSLVCTGKFCLIGVRTDESGQGRLDQHCVDEQVLPAGKGCAKDWKKWSEVCICEDNLCNTFAFLRSQIDGHDGGGSHHENSMSGNGGGGAVQRSLYHPIHQDEDDEMGDSMGNTHWHGGSRGSRDPRREDHRRGSHHSRGAPLVLLLVVLPLVVGAFTVFLVFLNYHCKML